MCIGIHWTYTLPEVECIFNVYVDICWYTLMYDTFLYIGKHCMLGSHFQYRFTLNVASCHFCIYIDVHQYTLAYVEHIHWHILNVHSMHVLIYVGIHKIAIHWHLLHVGSSFWVIYMVINHFWGVTETLPKYFQCARCFSTYFPHIWTLLMYAHILPIYKALPKNSNV